MNEELLALLYAMAHVEIFTHPRNTVVHVYDPHYPFTRAVEAQDSDFEKAVRKAHEHYTAYLETIPEHMR